GLPFGAARFAVVLDVAPCDVPPRYRERDRAERLLGVLADGVSRGGLFVAPAGAHDVQRAARRRGCRVALLCVHGAPDATELADAAWAAWPERDGLRLVGDGVDDAHARPLRADAPVAVQLAVALVRHATAAAARDVPC